ncbi:hypothetical protein Dsin_017381 [Dipteronia sinensis]|uniref:Uncharacterized protein n=1 Tax=Dipteronia sinensis TaxID=43782 RepID=A0AAE0E6V2_9ROSI|nr:hypothetical protein Dsin_017381 [Dipteronia sinensis]
MAPQVVHFEEEDLDLDAIKDPDNQRCFKWRAPKDIIEKYKLYGLNDAFRMELVEPPDPLKTLPAILELDRLLVDLMKKKELKQPRKIELKEPEEMVKETTTAAGTGRDG